ncbi:MAG: gamma-glutamylcyclotransferase [Acidobacteriota bacterium]
MEDFAKAHLFVYGTLRKGFRSHEMLRRLHAQSVAGGHVQGRLYDLGNYPGAVESASETDRIHGEVYILPNAAQAFRVLDRFEGYDPAKPGCNLFERQETTVVLAGGGRMRAWIYWLGSCHQGRRRVPSGDYAMCRA